MKIFNIRCIILGIISLIFFFKRIVEIVNPIVWILFIIVLSSFILLTKQMFRKK